MAGVNKVILVGNLGKNPEVKYFENGFVVANVDLVTTESYKDKNGNYIETTEWHHLEMWNNLAKIAEQYLNKGKTIYVEGRIKSDTWQDSQGNNRKNVRINVNNMIMIGNKPSKNGIHSTPSIDQPSIDTNTNSFETIQKKKDSFEIGEHEETNDLPF